MNKLSFALLFLATVICTDALSQTTDKRFKYTYHHHTYNQGVTLTLGEYCGVGYKRYLARKYDQSVSGQRVDKHYRFTTAFQATVAAMALPKPVQEDYFELLFEQLMDARENINGFHVIDASRYNGISIHSDFLLGADIKQSGLQVYVGLGLQVRSTSTYYYYGNGDDFGRETVRQNNFGINVIAGAEYMIPFKPLSFIVEVRPFLERAYGEGYVWKQFNAGIRYNFIRKPDTQYCGNCPK